jgi:hypothetical protein
VLASVLNAFYDAITITLREQVEKATLFECFGQILLIIDELVDGGIIMQTDANELASKTLLQNEVHRCTRGHVLLARAPPLHLWGEGGWLR